MAEAPFDLARAHRWFAVEFNNEAWELVERVNRSPQETQRMLHLAHAAALHWSAVGKPINVERAECLLATAYAAAGRWDSATLHLEYALTLSENGCEDETPFDRAAIFACAAKIYQQAKDDAEGPRYARLAREAFDALTEADDREVITQLYGIS